MNPFTLTPKSGLWFRRECARAQQQNIGITVRKFTGMGLSLRKKSNTPVAYQEADPGAYEADVACNKSVVKDFLGSVKFSMWSRRHFRPSV